MKKLLLILLFIPFIGFSQKIIKTDIFEVNYSEKFEQPLWLKYEISCINGELKRPKIDFRKVTGTHTSDNSDYKNNIWDKGHLAPSATFNCNEEMQESTFTFLNCALQHEKLNRGAWYQLEKFERILASFYKVNVKIDLIFDDSSIILPTGATVASFFIKTIQFGNETIIVKFPNKDVSGRKWSEFIILENN
tara:strand:+ start:20 stop:595 length:576 start_codon:yes stop_codon:yes gene_type:complete